MSVGYFAGITKALSTHVLVIFICLSTAFDYVRYKSGQKVLTFTKEVQGGLAKYRHASQTKKESGWFIIVEHLHML